MLGLRRDKNGTLEADEIRCPLFAFRCHRIRGRKLMRVRLPFDIDRPMLFLPTLTSPRDFAMKINEELGS